jgi:hypothetical protein
LRRPDNQASTDAPASVSPDCERAGFSQHEAMHPSCPLSLSPEDKLDALRSLDEFHFWHSLDDRRNCTRCGRSITGRQILVFELKGTRGRLRLQCPTAGCISTPSEWVYADPVLAARLKSEFGHGAQKFKGQRAELSVTPRRAKNGRNEITVARPAGRLWKIRSGISFREAAARFPILRSLVTGLRAILPVA